MRYLKPALTFPEQAELLIARGLLVDNVQTLTDYLQNVNYYRLSGYTYIFKDANPETGMERFKPGITFDEVRNLYDFDRQLRLAIMNAIERIEVAILRTRMVELHSRIYGPFGYTKPESYHTRFSNPEMKFKDPSKGPKTFSDHIQDIKNDIQKSNEEYISRFHKHYDDDYLPLWMVTDLMPFGQMLTMFNNLKDKEKQQLAFELGLFAPVLQSWLLTLNHVRNACAHHSRLWNRPLSIPPKLPNRQNDRRWYTPILVDNRNVFVVILIINELLSKVAPQDPWKQTIEQLLQDYPSVRLDLMGFPEIGENVLYGINGASLQLTFHLPTTKATGKC